VFYTGAVKNINQKVKNKLNQGISRATIKNNIYWHLSIANYKNQNFNQAFFVVFWGNQLT
jgi:hypothetical protein